MTSSPSSPLRILHLASSDRWTGVADPVVSIAREQQARGHRVWVACGPGFTFEEEARRRGVEVVSDMDLGRSNNPLRFLADVRFLREFCVREQVDIVHCHLPHDHWLAAMALRGLRRAPSHSGGTPAPQGSTSRAAGGGPRPRIVRTSHLSGPPRHDWFHRRLFRLHTDAVICVSAVAARATEAALGLLPGSVAVARGGVDLERFRPGQDSREMRRIIRAPDDAPLAVLVARVRAGRGPRWLLRAAPRVLERVPNARIVVFGRGELKKWFREEIRKPQYDGRVLNGGWRGGDQLPLLYACADVTLFLGLGSEGSCRAILEAMACGKPTIGTDIGAVSEIVADGETGLLVPHQDDAALADALVALLSDPARARALGGAARQRAEERFTESARAEAVLAVYDRLMAEE